MTKLTKISATALFALFLTACDKPADKAAEAPKAEATPAAQTQASAQAETTILLIYRTLLIALQIKQLS